MTYRALEARLRKLERDTSGGRAFVVETPADDSRCASDVLREDGHSPDPRDLVVRINRFSEGYRVPRVISAQ
jgi:hypothetical protein